METLFFWGILFFIAGQAFFMFKGIENIPFFLYHMFSTTHAPADSVQVLLIETPRGYFNTNRLSGREREMLLNTAGYYAESKDRGFQDPLIPTVRRRFASRVDSSALINYEEQLVNSPGAFDRFPAWWLRYFNSILDQHFDSLRVISTFVYPNQPHKNIAAPELVFIAANKQ